MTALLLTVLGLGRGVGGLDGVVGTERMLLLLLAITAPLGRWWSPPLQLRVAPPLFSRPLSQTLSGPVDQRGAVLGSLSLAAAVLVLGVCLPPPHRCHQQPLLLARMRCPLQVRRPLLQPLRPLRPVDVSVLRSLPAQRSAIGGRLVGRGPVRVGSVAGVGPPPLLALPVRPVYLPPLPPSPWIRR